MITFNNNMYQDRLGWLEPKSSSAYIITRIAKPNHLRKLDHEYLLMAAKYGHCNDKIYELKLHFA